MEDSSIMDDRFSGTTIRVAAPVLASLISTAVLLGWWLDCEPLKRIVPGLVAMNPLTAVVLIGASISLYLVTVDPARRRLRGAGIACGAAVATVGLIKLGGYLSLWDVPIDQLLFASKLLGPMDPLPNRIAPNTAMNLGLLGSALVLAYSSRTACRRIGLAMAALVSLMALSAGLGYLVGVASLYEVATFIPMAVHTAAALLILSGTLVWLQLGEGRRLVQTRFLWKLYGGCAALIVFIAVVIGLLLDRRLEQYLLQEARDRLTARCALLAEIGRQDLLDGLVDQRRLLKLGADTGMRLTLIQADGTVVGDSDAKPALRENHSTQPEVVAARELGLGTSRRRSTTSGSEMLYVAYPIKSDGKSIGYARAAVGVAAIDRELANVRGIVVLGAGMAGLVALVVAYAFARRVTAPLAALSGGAAAIAGGDFDQEITVRSADEIGQLARSFNLMSQRLRQHVSELQRAKLQAEQASIAAETATRSKSEFLANMSHEIRTPMAAIIGFADLMLEPAQTASDRLECINRIRRNGEHLLSVINDILDLSKIEAEKLAVERIRFEPALVLCEVMSIMRSRSGEKGLKLELVYDTPVPREISSDPTRLRQILINLVGNAIKFTPSGGHVRVGIRYDAAEGDSQRLSCEVSDSGIGISAEELPRMFQPYTQADTSTTRRYGGTGLGLTICSRLARLLGGEITVQSTPGAGSRFTVKIKVHEASAEMLSAPVDGAAPEAGSDSAASQTPKLSGRVLLAEDGLDNRAVLGAFLRSAGLEVVFAQDGQQAVTLVRAQQFDVILMDMQMPRLDGYGAASKLRSDGCELPIIALTANAMADDRDKCLGAGCTDYLSKPVRKAVLLEMVGRYLQARADEEIVRADPSLEPEITQLLPAFLQSLPPQVGQLGTLLAERDLAQLKRVVHHIKGAGGMYGFPSITDCAAQAEQRIIDDEPLDSIVRGVDELVSLIRRVEGYDARRETKSADERGA